jgi:hypothetical protein
MLLHPETETWSAARAAWASFPLLPTVPRPGARWHLGPGGTFWSGDALINYITGAGFPGDPASFDRWWPADLHVIGKDIARFHTVYWPAMLWSAGLEAPRHVWIHGWLLVQGERMSKSRGNFFDPNAMVDALGTDGTRYVLLREAAFDRDADVSWDSFLRRYNADLANDFGNLVNRTVTMARRYLGGERPAPRAADAAPLATGWPETLTRYRAALEGCRLHEALAEFAELVGRANRTVDAEQPWVLAKAAAGGDTNAAESLRGVLGDLIEACRLLAWPWRRSCRTRAACPAQLGHAYPYAADGNGGRTDGARLGAPCRRGRHHGRAGAALPATRSGRRAGLRPSQSASRHLRCRGELPCLRSGTRARDAFLPGLRNAHGCGLRRMRRGHARGRPLLPRLRCCDRRRGLGGSVGGTRS